MAEPNVSRLEYPEYIMPLLRRCKKVLSLQLYYQPELERLWCNNEFSLREKFSIVKEIFREFQNRGVNVSFEMYCLLKGIDPDQDSIQAINIPKFNSVLERCLNQKLADLGNMIKASSPQIEQTQQVKTGQIHYKFNSTQDLRSFNSNVILQNNQNPLSYNPIVIPEENETQQQQMMALQQNPNQINIINNDDDDDEEEEVEGESEEIITPYQKRTREYDKWNLFKTEINDPQDKTIRKKIFNSKKNNFWNSIAREANQNKYTLDILWLKSVDELNKIDEIKYSKIHGIINVRISPTLAPLTTMNATTYEGIYRDLMIANLNPIDVVALIDQEKVMPDILINEKKWKLLKFYVDFEPKEILWKSDLFRPKINFPKLDFSEININDEGFLN